MLLAILHHHLNRGGVTSVIANHCRALATLPDADRPERVVVLFDGQRDGWPENLLDELAGRLAVELVVEPALGYDAAGATADSAGLADVLAQRLAACGLSPEDTLLHTHNHSIGKSASLPGALGRLADAGWRMLLQVHDFAEDNRPENYAHLREATGLDDPAALGAELYPQGPGVHYATLTLRDAAVLRAAGVPDARLSPLPNPATDPGEPLDRDAARARVLPALGLSHDARLFVYPVRGIRRKNVGEMLLLAALAPENTHFAVTLAPKNPIERGSFDRWRRLAEDLELPCRFDTGGPRSSGGYDCVFTDMVAAADALVTTSIAEGFGMVFLEAWLAGRPLIGRDLPEITREFRDAGLSFDGLVESVRVPRGVLLSPEWVEAERDEAANEARIAFGRDPEHTAPGDWETCDFAELPVGAQAEVIEVACERRDELLAANPRLAAVLAEPPTGEVAANAAAVRTAYSTDAIGQRLIATLRSAWQAAPGPSAAFDGAAVLDHYLASERLLPVRLEAPEPEGTLTPSEAVLEPRSAAEGWAWYTPYDSVSRVADLQQRIAALSGPLDAQPTGETPVTPRIDGVRAVVFDVYGTLIVSGSGDISLASKGSRGAAMEAAVRSTLGDAIFDELGVDGDAIVERLVHAIRAAHAASPHEHPEVEIRDVWRTLLAGFGLQLEPRGVERLAVEYECRVNPVWTMPGLEETLDAFSEAGLPIGIVSNAQFFTPLAIAPLTGRSLDELGVDADLSVWSYEQGHAKPGRSLYRLAAEHLAAAGIAPGETLYVGNDLRNDVWPAAEEGFRTALFAGDARSLRWRRDDPRLAEVRPDAVVTDLRQLPAIVGVGD